MKQLSNHLPFYRLLKKHWAPCVLVVVVLYLLLEIRRTTKVQTTLKKEFAGLLKKHNIDTDELAYSKSTYFDVENRSKEKKDWHDYTFIGYEAMREGLGEQGKQAVLPKVDMILRNATYHANGYDGYLSDQISLNRSVPDTRHPNCKQVKYLADLPTVSAIVPFWNEHFSTLLRTAQSMLNRAPASHFLEVILVNDFSDIGFTWNELDDHVMEHYGDRVKVIHLKERMGLMAARTAGARAAKGDVLVFVDAHTEANVNWMPPLLEPIALNYKTVTVPYVDAIDVETFAYRPTNDGRGHRGIFDWEFLYHQIPRKLANIEDPIAPFQSPVMNGGLFAISAKYFWELGGYDEGLDVWGGEQFEISFKLWQCGGQMLDIPCSRFGHVFRSGGKEFQNPRKHDFLLKNYKRVALIWMDDYAKYIFARNPKGFERTDAGDMTKMQGIRAKLECKPFQWYLDNIATEVLKKYPPVVSVFASGGIRSLADNNLCVDTMAGAYKKFQLALLPCEGPLEKPTKQHQYFEFTYYRDIQYEKRLCFDAAAGDNIPIVLLGCILGQGEVQFWRYDRDKKMIYKDKKGLYCLDSDTKTKDIFVKRCNETNINQKWEVGFINETLMDSWATHGVPLEFFN